MNCVRLSLSCPLPRALTPATICGLTKSLGKFGISLLRCSTRRVRLRYGIRNSIVNSEKIPPNCCASYICVRRTSSAVVLSLCLTFKRRKASLILLSIFSDICAAVAKSAVLPTCTTATSSGLPCMIAPLPA